MREVPALPSPSSFDPDLGARGDVAHLHRVVAAFEGGTADDVALEIGSGQFIPGFEDQLVGVKAGEGASSEDEIMIVCIAEGEKPDMVELTEFMAERMPYFMVPRYIRFVDALPKTPTERVQKNKLREIFKGHKLPTA